MVLFRHRNHSQMLSLSTFIKCGFVPTLKDFNNFLVFLDRNQRFKVIIHVFSQLSSNKMNSDDLTCTIFTRALLKEHKYEEAADFLETLVHKSSIFHKNRIFDSLVQGLCTFTKNPDKGLSSLKDFFKVDGSFPSPRTFCLLIHCFSSIGKMDRVIELLNLMSNDKFKFPVDNYVCSSVISGFVRIGEPELAVWFYENAVKSGSLKPNTATCTAVVTAYCKLRSIGKIPDVVAWMQNNELDFDVVFYSNWIHGFFKEGLFSEALQIYRAIVDRKIELDIISYTILIAGFSNDGNVEKAVGFLYKMRKDGLKPNLVTYTAVILGFCKKGKLEEAFELFTMLKTLRFEFDEFTYAVLINGFCRNGDFDLVFHLLDEMEKKGINPGVVTYNTVINGLCKVGRTAEADDFSKGIVGDVTTYSTLLHGYVQERSASGILEINRRLKEAGIHMDLVMCNILIKALLMVGLFEDALAIYNALPQMDLSANSVTYCTLIDGCCKLGMIDEALKIFNEFRKISHLSAACYSGIILGLCKKGMVDAAINVFSEYITKGFHLDKEIYMMLIKTILDKHGAQDILNAIYRMENLGLQALNIICNDTIGFLCKMGFLEAACSISLFVISSEGLELTSIRYYSILRVFLIEGKKSLACLILASYFKIYGMSDLKVIKTLVHYLCLRDVRRTLVLLSTVNKMKWSVTIPVTVFETLTRDGKVLDAYELFVQAECNLPAMTVVDYTIMIDTLCKGRHVSKALDLCAFAKNEGIGLNTVTYNAVIHGLCRQGCLVEAFRLFDSLETIDVVASEFTYGTLMDALIKEGLLLDARILIKRMFLKGLHPSTHIFNSLISGYCKFGLLEEAVKLFQDLEVRSLKPDGFTVAALINGYCQKGDMEGALRLFFDFKRKCLLPDLLGFMYLIRGLSARGRMEESRSILREMLQTQSVIDLLARVDAEVKSDSVQNLLVFLCERGSINEAVTLLDEVGSMLFSTGRNSSYNALDSHDLGLTTDLGPSIHEEIDFHSLPSDVETKQNMLDVRACIIGKTQPLKDFDSFYVLIRSFCLKGELAKANRLTKFLMKF